MGHCTAVLAVVFVAGIVLAAAAQNRSEAKRRQADDYGSWTDKQIIESLLKRYRFPDPSANISVSVLLEIQEILDEADDKCHFVASITQKWMESILQFRELRDSLQPVKFRTLNYIWNPALSVDNAMSVVPLGKDSVRVFASGLVEYSHRLRFTVQTTEHAIRNFPFETRNCTIRFVNDDPRAAWSRLLRVTLPPVKSSLSPWIPLPAESSSNFHNLRLRMYRSVAPWVYGLFLPTAGLVIISWLFVFLAPRSSARLALSAIVFLVVLGFVAFHARSVPQTPFLKALDFWNIGICIFAFCAFVHAAATTSTSAVVAEKGPGAVKRCTLPPPRHIYEDDEKAAWLTPDSSSAPYYAQLPQPSSVTPGCFGAIAFKTGVVAAFCLFVAAFIAAFIVPFYVAVTGQFAF